MMNALTHRLLIAALLLATAQVSLAHNQGPKWLDEAALDRGLLIEIHHPGVVRERRSFRLRVFVANVAGTESVRVVAVRYLGPEAGALTTHSVNHALPSKRRWFEEYHALSDRISQLTDMESSTERGELEQHRMVLMGRIAANAFLGDYVVKPADIKGKTEYRSRVEVDVAESDGVRTLRRDVVIPVSSPLPNGRPSGKARRFDLATGETSTVDLAATAADELWYAGDQHLHTRYSIDAFFINRNRSNVADYAAVARATGLDWIIVTDHSNIDFNFLGNDFYTPGQFAAGTNEAAQYRADTGFLVYNGQEMGAGGGDPSHVLAYPFMEDSTGFLPNPCSSGLFGQRDCEPEQVILDRINGAGGLGFIAHPFESSDGFFGPWDFENGVTGWAGLEIFNSNVGELTDTDIQALLQWFELLDAIPAPVGGELPMRDGFPSRFPVGIGNSDAHEPERIGNTFTYCQAAEGTRDAILGSLVEGRCVASNGPLAYLDIDGAGPGEVATALPRGNTVTVTIQSTPEFGAAGAYTALIFVNGARAVELPPTGTPDFTSTTVFENVVLGSGIKYVVLAVVGPSGRLAIANPVWVSPASE